MALRVSSSRSGMSQSLLCLSTLIIGALGPTATSQSSESTQHSPKAIIDDQRAKARAMADLQIHEHEIALVHPQFKVTFEPNNIRMRPKRGPTWSWSLTSVGAAGNAHSIEPATPTSHQGSPTDYESVRYDRGGVVEEYLIKASCIEQRFLLPTLLDLNGEDLVISGTVLCDGTFQQADQGWLWSNGRGSVRLGEVSVFDASGETLTADMIVTEASTQICISHEDLQRAAYPVTIDPEIGPNDFRISDAGPEGEPFFPAVESSAAYNPVNHEYLVVWGAADTAQGVYGQRIDAATGAELGINDFLISEAVTVSIVPAARPQVAYNPTNHEYLVVWRGAKVFSGQVNEESEVLGQRLEATTCTEIGLEDFRISDMGINGDTTLTVAGVDVIHNAFNNEYFVVWSGENVSPFVDEIFYQRLDAATGLEIGFNDQQVSDMGIDGQYGDQLTDPAVAHNIADNEYLVVWAGDDTLGDAAAQIHGQRLDASTGAEIGANDFQISLREDMLSYLPFPDVAYNSVDHEYLVVWDQNRFVNTIDKQVYCQRLEASTATAIGEPRRISDMDLGFTFGVEVAHFPAINEYFVVWSGTEVELFVGIGIDEIFGQRLDAASGNEIGTNDIRLNDLPLGTFDEFLQPCLAISPGDLELLTAWSQGENLLVSEIHGQLYQLGIDFTVSPNNVGENAPLSFSAIGGLPSAPFLLAVTEFDGSPMFLNLGISPFDSDGRWTFDTIAPAFLTGSEIKFLGLGINRLGELQMGDLQTVTFIGVDCNGNDIPDADDEDCNTNGIPDDCDIDAQTSEDCNLNGIPDECDFANGFNDCNGNGMPDDCDIAAGSSTDCDGNGIPDECDGVNELDCNLNGTPDACDIFNGISLDCNSNWIPDECELDEFTDCNNNGVPDDCDISVGISADTDNNGIPDECQSSGTILVPGDYPAIQIAIDFSLDGAVILVADGIYTGEQNRNLSLRGKAIVVQSENGPSQCVIDCEQSGRAFTINQNEGLNSIIAGFTIRGGQEDDGGAMHIATASPLVQNCIFDQNNGLNIGGAVVAIFSEAQFIGCSFSGNTSLNGGGALYSIGSNLFVRNCSFADNQAILGAGGAIRAEVGGSLDINHSIVWDNNAFASTQIHDPLSIVTVNYCNVEGGWPGTGNLNTDPLFVDQANGDFHLTAASPCIDAGNPAFLPPAGELDFDGDARLLGTAVDIGADEF